MWRLTDAAAVATCLPMTTSREKEWAGSAVAIGGPAAVDRQRWTGDTRTVEIFCPVYCSARIKETGADVHRYQALALAHHQSLGGFVAGKRARRDRQSFSLA